MPELSYAQYVKDPLYGTIPISEKEKEVISTKVFQRLKNIKQLGTANFVYPGANHSRFEHSIGTMHATSLMLDRLNYSGEHKQSIRIAALLHDIGHGPFSHSFEEILVRHPDYAPIIDDEPLHDHEEFSKYILDNDPELKTILGSDLKRISDFISEGRALDGIPPELITGDMGSDRIDYLIRDTYYTGLGHRPDIDSLISNIRLRTRGRAPRIAITKEGVLAAELLITTRYYHYSMIAHHPKTRAAELLFLNLMEEILKEISKPEERMDFILNAFTRYDDSIILNKMFHSESSLRNIFYTGKSYNELYCIQFQEIRYGLPKYCFYRFFNDRKGRLEYCSKASEAVSKIIGHKVIADINLVKHYVPDLILFSDKYETEKELISPFTTDHSNIMRIIPGEQLNHCCIRFLTETEVNDDEKEKLRMKIDANRHFLSAGFLVPFSKERLAQDFTSIDIFYTFLCALRDFYNEKISDSSDSKQVIFRGVSRFYDLIRVCKNELNIEIVDDLKEFRKEESVSSFEYSIKAFSMLNAFHALGLLHMEFIPADKTSDKPYHKVYFIKLKEEDIRKKLYEDIPRFIEYREKFIRLFRGLDWKYFAEFFEKPKEQKNEKPKDNEN